MHSFVNATRRQTGPVPGVTFSEYTNAVWDIIKLGPAWHSANGQPIVSFDSNGVPDNRKTLHTALLLNDVVVGTVCSDSSEKCVCVCPAAV